MASKITVKQDKFCLAYLETGNASEAYRRAYSSEKMKGATINRNANTLLSDSKITARLDALRKPVIKKAQMTLEGHLDDLLRLRNFATQEKQIAAAITAEIARGKAAGIHIEKSQIDLNNLNPFVIVRYGNSPQ